MAKILKWLDWEFKTSRTNMINALMENIDQMQEQIGIEIKTLRIKKNRIQIQLLNEECFWWAK